MASQDPRGPAERIGGGGLGPQGGGGPAGGSTGTGGGQNRIYRSPPTTPPAGGPPSATAVTGYGAPVHYDYGKYSTNPDGSPTRTARTPVSLAAMESRIKQFNTDTIGDVLLGMIGIHKKPVVGDRMYDSPDVGRVWDPIETALGIGGMFNPALNAVSKIYTVTKLLTGFQGAAVPLNERQGPYLGKPDGSGLTGSVANPASPGPNGAPTIGGAGSGYTSGNSADPGGCAMTGTAGSINAQASTLNNPAPVSPFAALLSPSGRGRMAGVTLLGAPSGGI
jgi:hypothetical protein